LNEGYIIVNTEWYQFQTSDAPTGGGLRVTVPITTIGPGEYDYYDYYDNDNNEERPPMNQLNVVIFTTIRDDGPPESWRCLQNYDSSKEGVYLQGVILLSTKKLKSKFKTNLPPK